MTMWFELNKSYILPVEVRFASAEFVVPRLSL